jgi:hypothetical protein
VGKIKDEENCNYYSSTAVADVGSLRRQCGKQGISMSSSGGQISEALLTLP